MTNIKITGDRAKTLGPAPTSIYSLRRQFEGRKSLFKTGEFSFEASPHNLSLWAYNFPNATIEEETKTVFDGYIAPRPEFKLKRESLWWQDEAFVKLCKVNSFALFYEPGGGKSKSLTDLGVNLYCQSKIDAMIIWTPNAGVSYQWSKRAGEPEPNAQGMLERDIHESIEWSCWQWKTGTKKAALEYEQLKEFNGLQVVIMNVDAGKTPSGRKLMLDFIEHHKGRILFAIDESHLIKTPGSIERKTGKIKGPRNYWACEFGGKCNHRAILTGTPIAKGLIDAWSQFNFLDEKIIGVRYKTNFIGQYCITQYNPHSPYSPTVVGHKNIDKFYAKIDPYTYRITQEELGLEKMFDEFEFELYPEQRKHYDDLKKKFVTQLDNGEFLTASNAISAMTRMQQCSNGYLVQEDGTFQLLPNARLDAFQNWLEMISDDKLVIWCRYLQDANVIKTALGEQAVEYTGNIDKAQRQENKELFIHDKSKRFFIGTPDSAGTGTDGLQAVCNRAIRYSLSYNYIAYNQSENRTSRIGGKGTAFYTDLIGKGTLDRKILRNLAEKKDLTAMSLDDIRKLVE